MRAIFSACTSLFLLAFLAVPSVSAQDFNASSTYGEISLNSGFTPDPHTRSLTAGGSRQVDVGSCGYGYVADRPDFKLHYEAGSTFPLYIYAMSDYDVTLLVNTPDGRWVCDDDGYTGLNPLLFFSQPMSGRYDIWVGTYGDEMRSATLYISELNPNE